MRSRRRAAGSRSAADEPDAQAHPALRGGRDAGGRKRGKWAKRARARPSRRMSSAPPGRARMPPGGCTLQLQVHFASRGEKHARRRHPGSLAAAHLAPGILALFCSMSSNCPSRGKRRGTPLANSGEQPTRQDYNIVFLEPVACGRPRTGAGCPSNKGKSTESALNQPGRLVKIASLTPRDKTKKMSLDTPGQNKKEDVS